MEYKITNKINEAVIDEILRIKEDKGLTAEAIVGAAEKKTSPLHSFFDWDDTQAAKLWRLQQARVLINEVKVIVEDKEYFAFENLAIAVKTKDGQEERIREYVHRDEILTNEGLRRQMVAKAYAYLLYWQEQYKAYQEFELVFRAISEVKKKVKAVA